MSGTLYSSCRGWHCVSGDLTGTFLPRRAVFTLFGFAVFIRRFTPLRPDFFKGTARLRRNTAECNVFLQNPPLS